MLAIKWRWGFCLIIKMMVWAKYNKSNVRRKFAGEKYLYMKLVSASGAGTQIRNRAQFLQRQVDQPNPLHGLPLPRLHGFLWHSLLRRRIRIPQTSLLLQDLFRQARNTPENEDDLWYHSPHSEHYASSPTLSTFTYEYPMMVVTNTKSLFMRRKRRLRKIGVGEGSSDDTEEQEEEFNMFDQPTQYFL